MSNRSGTASEIDRERADSQINGSQQENAVAVSSLSSGSQTDNQGESENTSYEKNPKITNPHWENADGQTITKALVGDEVYLCVDVTDIDDGATATIRIVEKDDDGNDDDVKTLSAKVQNGKIGCKWKVIYTEDDDDSNSQQEKEEKGYTLPEYVFTVECDGVESEESGQLDVRGVLHLQIFYEGTTIPVKHHAYQILREKTVIASGMTNEDGIIFITDLAIGTFTVEV